MATPKTTNATRLQVLYATKGDKHIERIGGRNPDGSLWTMTREEAVRELNNKTLELFVHTTIKTEFEVDVAIMDEEFLRTKGDGVAIDNLLSLPEVPS